ncbi:MAG TPA: STAS domain-containing protein [Actinospica sp.]|nr:STAS domain-containing protein [Actinospica sp.]
MATRHVSTRTEVRRGVTVLFVSGEVDLAGSPHLERALAEAAGPGAPLVVDLTGVEFIDSAGLRALTQAELTVARLGGRLLIVPSPAAARVFEITSLVDAFERRADLDAALDEVAADCAPAEAAD